MRYVVVAFCCCLSDLFVSPFEHGEVFVLDDGGEVDLDLGNYERFLNVCLSRDNNITTGKIYNHVIEKVYTNITSRYILVYSKYI